jgi:hypothetical protein
MVDKLAVDLDALSVSATDIRGHGDGLARSDARADGRVSAAGSGWTGRSALALTVFAAKAKARSAAATTRIDDHSQHMRTAVEQYGANEEQRSLDMADIDRAGRTSAGNNRVNL